MTKIEIYLIALVALIGVNVGTYFYAHHKGALSERAVWEQRMDEAKLEADKRYQQKSEEVTQLEAALVKKTENTNAFFASLQAQVSAILSRPVYRDCKLDTDGLRLWNSANQGAAAGASTRSDVPLPEHPAPADRSLDGGGSSEPH